MFLGIYQQWRLVDVGSRFKQFVVLASGHVHQVMQLDLLGKGRKRVDSKFFVCSLHRIRIPHSHEEPLVSHELIDLQAETLQVKTSHSHRSTACLQRSEVIESVAARIRHFVVEQRKELHKMIVDDPLRVGVDYYWLATASFNRKLERLRDHRRPEAIGLGSQIDNRWENRVSSK